MAFIIFIGAAFVSILTTLMMFGLLFVQLPLVFTEYDGSKYLLKMTLIALIFHSILPVICVVLICGAWKAYAAALIVGYFIVPGVICFVKADSMRSEARERFDRLNYYNSLHIECEELEQDMENDSYDSSDEDFSIDDSGDEGGPFCANCNCRVDADAKVCPNCGLEFVEEEE